VLRDVQQLTARTFDLLVVGGGIYGLAIARDAAMRGLSVALVEADDFGSGSSFNHLRTIHGGLRYLQTLDLARARESIGERRTLARMAPQSVRPLAFALPLYRSLTRGRLAMRAGFLLDRLLASGRNNDVAPSLRLPSGRVVSRSEAIQRFPGMRRQGLTGAAVYFDYITTESDRLTFAWATAAVGAGAALANHVEGVALMVENRRVTGLRATDRVTGLDLEIGARLTVNATGAAVDRLLSPLGITARVPLLKVMNLVTSREAGEEAIGGRSRSGRHLFLVPWRGRALFGTWESGRVSAPDDTEVTGPEVSDFIRELNEAFPALDLRVDDITMIHRGLVPAAVDARGGVSLEGHERIRDHASEGIEGLMSIAGTKYTTARSVAERVTSRVLEKLRLPAVPCRTIEPLPGGAMDDPLATIAAARAEYDALLPSDSLPHLVASYGTEFGKVIAIARDRLEWLSKVADLSPVIGAELVWAARHEMAATLTDAVARRTPLGVLGYPGDSAVERAAALVGTELGWPTDRRRLEIDRLRAFYGTLNAWKA